MIVLMLNIYASLRRYASILAELLGVTVLAVVSIITLLLEVVLAVIIWLRERVTSLWTACRRRMSMISRIEWVSVGLASTQDGYTLTQGRTDQRDGQDS